MNDHNDQELSNLLRHWEVNPHAPRGFRSSVWTRIGALPEPGRPGHWRRLWRLLAVAAQRPTYAGTFAASALFLGVGIAHIHARSVTDQRREAARSEYVASISPLARIGPVGRTDAP